MDGSFNINLLDEIKEWIHLIADLESVNHPKSFIEKVDILRIIIDFFSVVSGCVLKHLLGCDVLKRCFCTDVMIIVFALEIVTKFIITPNPFFVVEGSLISIS